LFGVGALVCAPRASADHDSALPIHIVVGTPAGAQPMARVDPARSGCTNELPERPRELWNRGLRGGIEQVPAVDDRGNVIIATASGELAQLGADGTEQWRTRLGVSSASTAPVILSDATRFVVTAIGEAWGVSAQGTRKFKTDLSGLGREARVAALPRDDGSVVLGLWSRLVVLGPDGSIRDQVDTREMLVGALLGTRDGIIATSDTGSVWIWSAPLAPRKIGTLQGIARAGAALADAQTLVAVVDNRRLTAMDLRTGGLTTRETLSGLEGPPAAGPGSVAYAASLSGLLIGLGPAAETMRVALSPQVVVGDDGGTSAAVHSSPPVVCDRKGRVAFVRGDGRVGVVAADGRVSSVSSAACYDPLGVVPAAQRTFLVACRSGTLRAYGP
jgi:outer membrane protein assembly factor BamB